MNRIAFAWSLRPASAVAASRYSQELHWPERKLAYLLCYIRCAARGRIASFLPISASLCNSGRPRPKISLLVAYYTWYHAGIVRWLERPVWPGPAMGNRCKADADAPL